MVSFHEPRACVSILRMIWNKILEGLASTMEHFIFATKTGNIGTGAHPVNG